jgi:hypothetical protein
MSIVSHATVVTALIAVLTYMLSQPAVGANIGAGIMLLVVGGLGLPWSLVYLLQGATAEYRDSVETLIIVTSALVNVVLHGFIALFLTRRR